MVAAYPGIRVPIPELGVSVRLRKWSCAERRHYSEEVADKPGCMVWVFVHSAADKRGRREFKDSDIPLLGCKPYLLLERVYRAALEHNGLLLEKDIAAREQELADNWERRFWFLLAGHLKKTVGELQRTMSVDEFKDWLAYARRHPIGDDLADMHFAMLMQAVLCAIPRKRGSKPPKVADLIVDWWKPKRQSEEQIQATFNMFFNHLKAQHVATHEREQIGGG